MIVARRPFPRIPLHFHVETSPSIPKVPKLTFSDPPLPNSFPCHTSAKFTRNSFRCHTYKFALLQVLSLPHIQKTGGCPMRCASCSAGRSPRSPAAFFYPVAVYFIASSVC